MLNDLLGIKVEGGCFASPVEFNLFPKKNRLSLLLGRNGSGKTTIGRAVLAAIGDEQDSKLKAAFVGSEGCDLLLSGVKVHVFNEDFVDKNVRIPGGDPKGDLEAIVLLGDQVELDEQINKLTKQLKDAEKSRDLARANLKEYDDERNPKSPAYHFKEARRALKKEEGWAGRQRIIEGRKNNAPVNDDLVCRLGSMILKNEDSYESLMKLWAQELNIFQRSEELPEHMRRPIGAACLDPRYEEEIVGILSKRIENSSPTPREARIVALVKGLNKESIYDAKKRFESESFNVCPYCFQDISDVYRNQILSIIEGVFNEEVDEHNAELERLRFPELNILLEPYKELSLDLVFEANGVLGECRKIIDAYKAMVEKKRLNLFEPIPVEPLGLTEGVAELNNILASLEEKRLEYVAASNNREELKRRLMEINDKLGHFSVVSSWGKGDSLSKERNAWDHELNKECLLIKRLEAAINELKAKQKNEAIALEEINRFLGIVFASHDRLELKVSGSGSGYRVYCKGVPLSPNQISVGERNALALCYFFVKVHQDCSLKERYSRESFIVLDDPISSFDHENQLGIKMLICSEIENYLKGDQQTKVLIMSHDAIMIRDLELALGQRGRRLVPTSELLIFNLKPNGVEKMKGGCSQYQYLWSEVVKFAIDPDDERGRYIGNMARKALEAYTTFVFGSGIGIDSGSLIEERLGSRAGYFRRSLMKLFMDRESHMEDYVNNDAQNGIPFAYIERDEKVRFCKDILCMLMFLDDQHIKHLMPNEYAIVKGWSESIPLSNREKGW